MNKIGCCIRGERRTTWHGYGEVLATVILLETSSVERFADAGHYASYWRCVGSAYLSNGKNGNRYLAWAFVEAANVAVRHCESARRFYQRKQAERNSTVAIKAVAHKLARGLAITCSSCSSPSVWSAALHRRLRPASPFRVWTDSHRV